MKSGVVLVLLLINTLLAQDTVKLYLGEEIKVLNTEVNHLGPVSVDKTVKNLSDYPWKPIEKKHIDLGYNNDADWVRMVVKNTSSEKYAGYLHINKPLIDQLELFIVSSEDTLYHKTGILNRSEEELTGISHFLPVEIPANESRVVYIKIVSKYSKLLPLSFVSEKSLFDQETFYWLLLGLIIGAYGIIATYNIFIGLKIKDQSYIFFSFANLGALFTLFVLKGGFTALTFNEHLVNFFVPFGGTTYVIFSSLFVRKYLDTKNNFPLAELLFKALISLQIITFVVPYILNLAGDTTTYKIITYFQIIFCLIAMFTSRVIANKGNRDASIYFAAISIYFVFVVSYALALLGHLPFNKYTSNFVVLGPIVEMLIMTFALSNKYNLLKLKADEAEASLNYKSKDIEVMSAMNLYHIECKKELSTKLKDIVKKDPENIQYELKQVLIDLNSQKFDNDRQIHLSKNTSKVNSEFKERLKDKYPSLTKGEIDICNYLLLDMSDNDIAEARKSTQNAIKVARYRMRKKMDLTKDQDLTEVLKSI